MKSKGESIGWWKSKVSIEDHLLSAGGVSYQFDLDGFLINRNDGGSITTYNYSSRVGLLSATLPDSRVISYENDPLGRRIAKRINGTITEKYLWKGLTQLLAVYDGSNNLLMRFEYADGRLPVSMMTSSGRYYLFYDQVGALKAVADGSGAVVRQIEYDLFGNILSDSNAGFEMPFGFAGGLHDRDTGLVRFGMRDYDPGIGRWTAKDPIFFAGGDADLYGYVQNDPVSFIDPDGRVVVEVVAVLTLAYAAYSAVDYMINVKPWLDLSPDARANLKNAITLREEIYRELIKPCIPNARRRDLEELRDSNEKDIEKILKMQIYIGKKLTEKTIKYEF